jgi:tetratricopeptide (TPR) repeat protein
MGEVALARRRFQEAVEYFDRAIRIAPWKSAYYWNIALAHEGLSNCTRALESWRRYLDLESDADSRRQVEQHIAENYGQGGNGCGRSP